MVHFKFTKGAVKQGDIGEIKKGHGGYFSEQNHIERGKVIYEPGFKISGSLAQ